MPTINYLTFASKSILYVSHSLTHGVFPSTSDLLTQELTNILIALCYSLKTHLDNLNSLIKEASRHFIKVNSHSFCQSLPAVLMRKQAILIFFHLSDCLATEISLNTSY